MISHHILKKVYSILEIENDDDIKTIPYEDFEKLEFDNRLTGTERQKAFEYILYLRPELFREYANYFSYSEDYLILLLYRDIRNYELMKRYDTTGKLKMVYELLKLN